MSPGDFITGKVLWVFHSKQSHSYPGMMYCCQLLLTLKSENKQIWQKNFFVGKIIFKTWLDMTFRIFIFLLSCPSFEQGAQVLWKSHVCWDVVWTELKIYGSVTAITVTEEFFSGLVLWVNSEHISCLIYALPPSLHSHFSTLINFQTLSHPFSFLNHTDLSFQAPPLHFLLISSVLSGNFGHLNS